MRWLILGGGLACGARTGLEVPYDRAQGGGAPDGGGGSGGADVVRCDELTATPAAHVRLPNNSATVLSVEIVRPPSAPGLVCVVSDVVNDDGSWTVAHGCFEAWGIWPGSLGTAFLAQGSDGGVAATEGRAFGYAILLGNLHTPDLLAALDVAPNESAVPWTSVAMQAPGFRPAFMSRAPDGAFFGGLSHVEQDAERLDVVQVEGPGVLHLGEIACAHGALSADAISRNDDIVVVTSTGHAIGACPVDDSLAPPNRLHVVSLGRGGGTELLFETEHAAPVVDARAVAGDADRIWVGWESGGAVMLASIGPKGAEAPPITVAEGSAGAIALARRDHTPVMAYAELRPDGEPIIRVVEVHGAGDIRLLGELDTDGATWLRDLEMVVDPSTGSIVVAYVGRIGTSERAFARRLSCP